MSQLVSRLRSAGGVVSPAEVVDLLRELAAAAKVVAESAVEIERIRAVRDQAVTKITEDHRTMRLALVEIFAERRAVLEGHFRLIDTGIARGDDSLINKGLVGVAEVVQSSPFSDLDALRAIIDRGDVIDV